MLSTIYLVAEDEATLCVGRKLVGEVDRLSIYREDMSGGCAALRKKCGSYQQMGQYGLPVLMITDLNDAVCAPRQIHSWLGCAPAKGFLFRVCVREVEAWLLADREALAGFMRISAAHIPDKPELLLDPKAELIRLAQKASRQIRVGMTPVGSATIGRAYNALLADFIRNHWSLGTASKHAPSLARARKRIREFADAL